MNQYKSTGNTNGKNIFSSVVNKVRGLRDRVMAFFAPSEIEEVSMAIA